MRSLLKDVYLRGIVALGNLPLQETKTHPCPSREGMRNKNNFSK
jgi:hypothetical protein